MASNHSVYPDNSDFDDYSDWVELYNPAGTNVSLAGYYLTDDLSLPLKWQVPAGASIPGGGYLMIRADGFSAGPGETHVRGYYPWGSTFVTRRYHAAFKLSADGEELGLYRVATPPVESVLIPVGGEWRYRDEGTDPGPAWMALGYDDSGWGIGVAEFGYGDGDEATVVSYGPDAANKFATTHFRRRFTVSNPALVGNVRLRVLADDGAIIYLNGEELGRIRMPAGTVTYQDYSGQSMPQEEVFEVVDVTAGQLRAGDNLLAVEVHQVRGSSSDISFDAELVVDEITSAPMRVDGVAFGPQATDVSDGRDPASPPGWSHFAEATPETANTSEVLTQLAAAPAVAASLDSGLYVGAQGVALSGSGAGETIRYTLNGAVPTSQSPVYSNALDIAVTTVLRARSFAAGHIPGPVLTRTYFLGEDASPTLPVVSMVADPDTLFGGAIGIYENDTAYPYKGREIPARIELFEADGSPAFAVSAGARIAGENIWQKAQKPFNIYCRSKYGDDQIPYALFPGEPVGTFGEFNLRNGGDDWEETMLRDALIPELLAGRSEASLYSYRPATLFINGEYWGIYNIRKRFDPVTFANEHQLSKGEYDLTQYAHNESGATVLMADAGTTDAYEAFRAFVTAHDPADPAVYGEIREQMNIDSFIDYVVATDYAVNTSWSHNREFWSGHAPGSRWHWIVNDLDRGMSNASGSIIGNFRGSYTLFRRLILNPDFVNRLMQRYAAHLGSTFHPDRVANTLDAMAAEVDAEVARHTGRWPASMTSRESQLAAIRQFAVNRPAAAASRLQLELGVSPGLADLAVAVSPAGGGTVHLAGVPVLPAYTSTVAMFMHLPVELAAEPAPGYAFSGWSNGSTNPVIEITLPGAASITATFVAGAETVLPARVAAEMTLTAADSPYSLEGDLVVEAGATLHIDAGVEVRMPQGASLIVHGALQAIGTAGEPVLFASRLGRPWGNIGFVNAAGESTLSHVILRGATRSRSDPWNLKAAVSAYNSTITMDHVDIDADQPVFARFGSTTLRNSRIHIRFTGDGINIKSGRGLVEDCTFTGSDAPDTDAVDFDDVVGGIIRGNRIYAFRGFNSDAIDVGEGCVGLIVAGNRIFNIRDKGVSVGQGSVAYIERNLIVNCEMGVGVKDTGSTAYIDQNTFVRNHVAVASYEKNPGKGGGAAYVRNSIISRSQDAPISVDALSTLRVDYTLCDTAAPAGVGNLLADPGFRDAGSYDFSLAADSPAINTGDPAHALDADGSRADMGAYYQYDPADYPYLIPNVVVVNEVLSYSANGGPDWIELHNSSSQPMDLGGWYLSDDSDNPRKYRIADGTMLPGNGYIIFSEDAHFGLSSSDPGALVPFALSKNGDTIHVFGPGDELRPDYTEKESFGPSLPGVTQGRHYKASTKTYNFVASAASTPWAANSLPLVGPVVISEIMYHPPYGDAEYIELTNIRAEEVVLFDAATGEPWRMTKGITYAFPSVDPVRLAPGEKILLVRDLGAFVLAYGAAPGTQIFQWDSGRLDNGGESLELSLPGDVDELGVRQYIRVDRVNYDDEAPWPIGPDGSGTGLVRINEREYGNDVDNWTEADATPGRTAYQQWCLGQEMVPGQDGPGDDPDGDGLTNAEEYAGGTDAMTPSVSSVVPSLQPSSGIVAFGSLAAHPDITYRIQRASSLLPGDWNDLPTSTSNTGGTAQASAVDPFFGEQAYYRLMILLHNLQ